MEPTINKSNAKAWFLVGISCLCLKLLVVLFMFILVASVRSETRRGDALFSFLEVTWAWPGMANKGVSENSVPLFTQWFCWSLSHIIPVFYGYFLGNLPNIFRQTHNMSIETPWLGTAGSVNSWALRGVQLQSAAVVHHAGAWYLRSEGVTMTAAPGKRTWASQPPAPEHVPGVEIRRGLGGSKSVLQICCSMGKMMTSK